MTLLMELLYPLSFAMAIMFFLVCFIVMLRKMNGIKKEISTREDGLTEVREELKKLQQMVSNTIAVHYSPSGMTSDKNLHYNYASKILQSGGSIEEIMNSCDLSRSEAELLSALQITKS
jgi:hypothetical protein